MNTQYNDSGKKETDMNRQIRCMSFKCLNVKMTFPKFRYSISECMLSSVRRYHQNMRKKENEMAKEKDQNNFHPNITKR